MIPNKILKQHFYQRIKIDKLCLPCIYGIMKILTVYEYVTLCNKSVT